MTDANGASEAMLEARAKLRAKMGASTQIAGGARRKKRNVHKASGQDDKRLQNTLKRIGMNSVPGIEEVNMFKSDGDVIHFAAPKVQANIAANTYVIAGNAEEKKLTDMLPGIITQLGPDNLTQLKNIASSLGAAKAAPGGDEDIPDITENFDEVS
jgi:nascent polypeptide-associated complex subunit beta